MKYSPHKYQTYATNFILEHPISAVFLDMGLGKSVITLTAIFDLCLDSFLVRKVLVIAPLRVALDTWPSEIEKWDHLRGLTYSVAVGNEAQRKAALLQRASVYIINRENVGWLVESSGLPFDYDMVVIDELSSFKSYRPGARFGPAAMRHESYGLETYSPYQDKDLTDIKVFDSGDMELCFGSSESALKDIEARAETILQDGKFPLLLGGEHLVTLGAVRAAAHKYPAMHIIHFDAHADLRQDYLGAELSHACVLRRCHDILGDGRIHQFCIRSGDREEFTFAKTHTEMHKFDFSGLEALTAELCRTQVPVYLTIDLDCLDPSCFPGTGTPEAGGMTFMQLLNAILTVSKTNIIGADVNELAPMLDASGVSTAMACKVLRELLLALNV